MILFILLTTGFLPSFSGYYHKHPPQRGKQVKNLAQILFFIWRNHLLDAFGGFRSRSALLLWQPPHCHNHSRGYFALSWVKRGQSCRNALPPGRDAPQRIPNLEHTKNTELPRKVPCGGSPHSCNLHRSYVNRSIHSRFRNSTFLKSTPLF